MVRTLYKSFLLTFICWLPYQACISQDIHFSQYDYSPINMNPALTGIFRGDTRYTGNVRSQWYSVPVNYLTASGAIDFKFYDQNLKNSLFSGGVLFNYDRAGHLALSLAQLGLSASLTQHLSTRNFMTLGAQFNFSQRSFKLDDLTFDNQFNGDQFVPTLSPNESFDKLNNVFVDFAVGLNWHFQIPEKRVRLDMGLGLHHINQPETSFMTDEKVLLPSRLNIYSMGSFGVTEKFDLVYKAMHQRQGPHEETVVGGAFRALLNDTRTREVSAQFGLGYRFDDAFFPEFHLFYGPWVFGLSYDVNISEFSVATNSNGAVELSVVYIFTKVRPIENKICPIF